MTHQTSQASLESGIVALPPATPVTPAGGKEDVIDAETPYATRHVRCARCGRPGRWVRHVTLAHLRPRSAPRR